MDFIQLIARLRADNEIREVMSARAPSFGNPNRPRKFLEMLPPQIRDENLYYEDDIRFKGVIAAVNERYSPPVIVEGEDVASVLVTLGDSGISRELKANVFDAIAKLLARGEDMAAMTRYLQFVRLLREGLDDLLELQAVQAVLDGVVTIKGPNGVATNYAYLNPPGHRVTVAADSKVTDPDVDPYDTLSGIHQTGVNAGKGNAVRAITSNAVIRAILSHPKTGERFGRYSVGAGGTIQGIRSRVQLGDYNDYLQADGLPALEPYDMRYRTQINSYRFMPEDALVFQFDSGRDPELDLGDEGIIRLPNGPSGYTAIGTTAGVTTPGQIIRERPKLDETPPHVEVDAVQTHLTVILDPETLVSAKGLL